MNDDLLERRSDFAPYRAKTADSSEWIEGYFFQKNYVASNCSYIKTIKDQDFLIETSTLCRNTGRKDSRGKYIFSGDYLQYKDEESGKVDFYEVIWDYRDGCFYLQDITKLHSGIKVPKIYFHPNNYKEKWCDISTSADNAISSKSCTIYSNKFDATKDETTRTQLIQDIDDFSNGNVSINVLLKDMKEYLVNNY